MDAVKACVLSPYFAQTHSDALAHSAGDIVKPVGKVANGLMVGIGDATIPEDKRDYYTCPNGQHRVWVLKGLPYKGARGCFNLSSLFSLLVQATVAPASPSDCRSLASLTPSSLPRWPVAPSTTRSSSLVYTLYSLLYFANESSESFLIPSRAWS